MQSKVASEILAILFEVGPRGQIRIGSILGISTSVLSWVGIKIVKYTNLIVMVVLFIGLLIFCLARVKRPDSVNLGISFSGILFVVSVTLPGILNLPTFFRHARSEPHAFLGIAVMTIATSLFQWALLHK